MSEIHSNTSPLRWKLPGTDFTLDTPIFKICPDFLGYPSDQEIHLLNPIKQDRSNCCDENMCPKRASPKEALYRRSQITLRHLLTNTDGLHYSISRITCLDKLRRLDQDSHHFRTLMGESSPIWRPPMWDWINRKYSASSTTDALTDTIRSFLHSFNDRQNDGTTHEVKSPRFAKQPSVVFATQPEMRIYGSDWVTAGPPIPSRSSIFFHGAMMRRILTDLFPHRPLDSILLQFIVEPLQLEGKLCFGISNDIAAEVATVWSRSADECEKLFVGDVK